MMNRVEMNEEMMEEVVGGGLGLGEYIKKAEDAADEFVDLLHRGLDWVLF